MDDEQDGPREQGNDPAEQDALARDLGDELTEGFVRFVRGDIEFAELTFLTYEMLHDLHIIASGEYEVEYEEENGDETAGETSDHYDRAAATEQQEDLAQEPART